MARMPFREFGTGRVVFVDNPLLDLMSSWERRVEVIAGYFGHVLRLSRLRVRNVDGKIVAVDPTVLVGRCSGCRATVVVCPDMGRGVRTTGLRKKCRQSMRAASEFDSWCRRLLQKILRKRGDVELVPTNPSHAFVIRQLADRLYEGKVRVRRSFSL